MLHGLACCIRLHTLLHVIACCCMLLGVNCCSASFETDQTFEPTFLLFLDPRSIAQQRWISLHSFSNTVGAKHVHYTGSPKSYGLYSFHDALQVLCCIRLNTTVPIRTQNFQCHCWPNNVGSCCVHLELALFRSIVMTISDSFKFQI